MKTFSYGILLSIFWLLLSGHVEPQLLGLGLVSVAFTVFLAERMNIIDHESHPLRLSARFPAFLVYLFREVVKANIDVTKRIVTLSPTSISPQLITLPLPQKTDLGRVVYANAITLTPGTVSVELTQDEITVHALTKEAAGELSNGEMAKVVQEHMDEK